MARQTFAQLTAPAAIDSAADPVAALKAARLAKKSVLYVNLEQVGVSGVYSWTTGSVPSSLVEIYAWALTDYDITQAYVALGSLNSTAEDEALDDLSYQVYDNERVGGSFTIARLLLVDDAGAGPWTFQPSTVSYSVGKGGLLYNGFDFAGSGLPVTLPRGGKVYVYVKSESTGSQYAQLALGAVNFQARGALPGVSVTNDSTWLSFSGAVAGSSDEADTVLRERNKTKWGTLGTGSPSHAYRNLVLSADPTRITRVETFTNFDILDPGRIDVVIAGPAGAVGPDVVLIGQNAVAPLQIGGDKIPETARAVVTSAVNHTITVSATVYVQKEYNTTEFQAQVAADYATFAGATKIGGGRLGIVSCERLQEILTFRAALAPGIILDVADFLPSQDVPLVYNEVPLIALSLTWIPV